MNNARISLDHSQTFVSKRRTLFGNLIEQLQNSDNENFWNQWKTFNDKQPSSHSAPILKDGNKWEHYYGTLFQQKDNNRSVP